MTLKNLLHNRWANFKQSWHETSLGEGNSSLFKWRAKTLKGRLLRNSEKTLSKIKKTLLLQNPWADFNQTCHKAYMSEDTQGFTNQDHSILKKRITGFLLSLSMLWYNLKCVYWFQMVPLMSDVAHGPLVSNFVFDVMMVSLSCWIYHCRVFLYQPAMWSTSLLFSPLKFNISTCISISCHICRHMLFMMDTLI